MMTNLTQISSRWLVSEQNGERVARPVNPYEHPYQDAWPHFKDKQAELDALPTFYTNHTPGSYKAEELGEVVWQKRLRDGGEWHLTHHNAGLIGYDYRLFVEQHTK